MWPARCRVLSDCWKGIGMSHSEVMEAPEVKEAAILRRYVRALARYERLLEISRALISTLDIDALLEQIVVASSELTDTEASSILLLDKLTGSLRFEAAIDVSGFAQIGRAHV